MDGSTVNEFSIKLNSQAVITLISLAGTHSVGGVNRSV